MDKTYVDNEVGVLWSLSKRTAREWEGWHGNDSMLSFQGVARLFRHFVCS